MVAYAFHLVHMCESALNSMYCEKGNIIASEGAAALSSSLGDLVFLDIGGELLLVTSLCPADCLVYEE